jgi:phosphohistidine phosphatase
MKRLLLLRHAKAVQTDKDGADDISRELTRRGRKDAARMGAWLHEHGMAPNLVLCSTSARTRETWSLVAEELGGSPEVEFMRQLYLAPVKTFLAAIENVDDGIETLMTVGHNPGTEETVAMLARVPEDKKEKAALETLTNKFPTAALAVLEFDIQHWRDANPRTGALTGFVRPKDLG